ncbi:MAG: PH domain-containing protein [Myxococcota bacterium]
MTPLSPRARWLFHAQALLQFLFLGPPLIVGAFFGGLFLTDWTYGLGLSFALAIVLAIGTLWWPTLAFERWGYLLDDDKLLIRSGVLMRRMTAIPSARIQHVDTHQGPMERLMGLARLTIYTASGSGADGMIPGLTLEEATRLRDALVLVGDDDVV